ncbi:MAG: 5'-methylthioadenosine/S-adenosylhomocysteine nucleosidase [Chloroflexi bacterium]|nr:5'-methylthioadenosine/S-adenosylhomocysteine nucleosidase [Chloroflexota bacterium]
MKTIVLISANAEWRVVKELYPDLVIKESPFGEFAALNDIGHGVLLFHGGWGKIAAAATTQYVIDHFEPDLLVNLGTCGGFEGRIETGTVILVERTLVYDIVERMGDGAEAIKHYGSSLDLSWLSPNVPHPILRGLLVSADRDIVEADIPMLIRKYDAVAADWESGAIAWVAQRNEMPLLILRAVSDLVGGGGGEAYGNLELFHDRTKIVMRKLFNQLPDWLNSIKL